MPHIVVPNFSNAGIYKWSCTCHFHLLMNYHDYRNLLIKCWTSRKAREWAESIKRTAHEHAKDFTEPKRFNSFAPVREDSYARWYAIDQKLWEIVLLGSHWSLFTIARVKLKCKINKDVRSRKYVRACFCFTNLHLLIVNIFY